MKTLKLLINFFSSIKFALICLFLLFVIVLIGTFSQINHGIFYVQKIYFQSFFIYYSIGNISIPIFPGGGLVGTFLVINLILSTLFNIVWKVKNIGLVLIHLGMIVLLIGGGISSCVSTESQIYLKEGDSTYYSEDLQKTDLVIIDGLNPNYDTHINIPFSLIQKQSQISHDSLPFTINVHTTYKNVQLKLKSSEKTGISSHGIGKSLSLIEIPEFTKDDQRNNRACILSFGSDSTYLAALDINGAQKIMVNGNPYYFLIQPKRYLFPFLMSLKKFTRDYYPGSEIPKNYSSLVTLKPFDSTPERDVLIYMNHPLRYELFTFYQASFGQDEPSSILQVVFNPTWTLPYISCLIISLGMAVQFFTHLLKFSRKRKK